MAQSKKRVGGRHGGATDGVSARDKPVIQPNANGNRAERRAAKKEDKK